MGPARIHQEYSFIIFDCDGILADSEPISCEAMHQAVLKATGGSVDIPSRYPDDYVPVFGTDLAASMAYYNRTMNLGWDDLPRMTALVSAAKETIYKKLIEERGLHTFPGVVELIEKAKALGVKIGVGSSGTLEKIWNNLRAVGLADAFEVDHVVSATEVQAGKPAPDVYLEVMKRLGCNNPVEAFVIEDAVLGLRAAKAAGALAVGITNTLPRSTLEPEADLVLSSLSQIDLEQLPRIRVMSSRDAV